MNWSTKKLGEICVINMGQSPLSSTYNDKKNGLPFYQGKKDYGVRYPVPRVWCAAPIKIVEGGDILISVRAPIGSLNIAQERSCIGRGLAGLRSGGDLDQDFLWHFLKLNQDIISALGTGSTFTAISKKNLENLEIPLPPVMDQKKIVAKLDKMLVKIKEAKWLRAESLVATESLLSAELHRILEENVEKYGVKKIFDVIEKVSNYSAKTLPSEPFKYIDISSVSQGKGIVEHKIYSIGNAPSRAQRPLKEGDVLFALTRPYLRNIAYVYHDYNDAVASTGFSLLRAKKDMMDSRFLYYVVVSDWFVNKVLPFQKGATYPAIGESVIWRQEIPLPPLAEQKKIVTRLDDLSEKIKKLREYQKKTQSDLDRLEQSILQKAFSEG